jgi:hypothetical protein
MKKLDDKILNKGKEEEEITNGRTDVITCDCCNLPSATLATEAGEEEKQEYEQAEHHHEDKSKKKFFDNPKLLIFIGLALTIPIACLN